VACPSKLARRVVKCRYLPVLNRFDMFTAAALGLTPLSPTGILGTLLTMRIRPVWKPAQPERFAWVLGGSLGALCLGMRLGHVDNAWIIGVAAICFMLTWLEAVLGFCVGCWMYSLLFECEVCQAPYRRNANTAPMNHSFAA
jgi:Domain of unknown function (DUF4395)